jgi:hypothetical protein
MPGNGDAITNRLAEPLAIETPALNMGQKSLVRLIDQSEPATGARAVEP